MRISIEKTLSAAPPQTVPSPRVLEVAAMFGLGVDDSREITIVPRCEIPLPTTQENRGGIVFVTGPSGSGKSTILRLVDQQCIERDWPVLRFDQLPALPEVPLVEAIGESLERATMLLSLAGLGDAFAMLRTPAQLSDGQRYRLKIAQAMEMAKHRNTIILADEFAATLDRLTAQTIARNLRRWIDRTGQVLIAATTHDDLLEALDPDVLIYKGLGDQIEVMTR